MKKKYERYSVGADPERVSLERIADALEEINANLVDISEKLKKENESK